MRSTRRYSKRTNATRRMRPMRSMRRMRRMRPSRRQRGGAENITLLFRNGYRRTLNGILDTDTVRAFKDVVREVAAIPADRQIHFVVNGFELRDEDRTLDDYQLRTRLEDMGDAAHVQVNVFPPM